MVEESHVDERVGGLAGGLTRRRIDETRIRGVRKMSGRVLRYASSERRGVLGVFPCVDVVVDVCLI